MSLAFAAPPAIQTWSVTAHVAAVYSGSNLTYDYGFVVRDALSMSSTRYRIYDSFQSTTPGNRPRLAITWG